MRSRDWSGHGTAKWRAWLYHQSIVRALVEHIERRVKEFHFWDHSMSLMAFCCCSSVFRRFCNIDLFRSFMTDRDLKHEVVTSSNTYRLRTIVLTMLHHTTPLASCKNPGATSWVLLLLLSLLLLICFLSAQWSQFLVLKLWVQEKFASYVHNILPCELYKVR